MPVVPPIIAFSEQIKYIIYLCLVLGRMVYIVINNGASFCQVDKIPNTFVQRRVKLKLKM